MTRAFQATRQGCQVTLGGTFYGAYDLDLDDDFVYVADTSRGLLILRETD